MSIVTMVMERTMNNAQIFSFTEIIIYFHSNKDIKYFSILVYKIILDTYVTVIVFILLISIMIYIQTLKFCIRWIYLVGEVYGNVFPSIIYTVPL